MSGRSENFTFLAKQNPKLEEIAANAERDWSRVDELVKRIASNAATTEVQKALLQAEILIVKGSKEDFKQATALLVATIVIDGGRTPALQVKIPGLADGLLLVALGAIGTFAHLLMTWSLRYAPSATLAPMQYLEIPFTTLAGWLIFHDLPGGIAAVGIVIIVASGLYIVFRERATARPAPVEV